MIEYTVSYSLDGENVSDERSKNKSIAELHSLIGADYKELYKKRKKPKKMEIEYFEFDDENDNHWYGAKADTGLTEDELWSD